MSVKAVKLCWVASTQKFLWKTEKFFLYKPTGQQSIFKLIQSAGGLQSML